MDRGSLERDRQRAVRRVVGPGAGAPSSRFSCRSQYVRSPVPQPHQSAGAQIGERVCRRSLRRRVVVVPQVGHDERRTAENWSKNDSPSPWLMSVSVRSYRGQRPRQPRSDETTRRGAAGGTCRARPPAAGNARRSARFAGVTGRDRVATRTTRRTAGARRGGRIVRGHLRRRGDHPHLIPHRPGRVDVGVGERRVVPCIAGLVPARVEARLRAEQESGDRGMRAGAWHARGERVGPHRFFEGHGDLRPPLQRHGVVRVVRQRRVGSAPDVGVVVHALEQLPAVLDSRA